jgi:hypothetical protein
MLIPSEKGNFDQTIAYGYKMEEKNPLDFKESIFGLISLKNLIEKASILNEEK